MRYPVLQTVLGRAQGTTDGRNAVDGVLNLIDRVGSARLITNVNLADAQRRATPCSLLVSPLITS